jgi:uncharacterized protein
MIEMEKLVGRVPEIKILTDALASPRAELIAVYGRRRVGKTYLIQTVYEENIVFQFTGMNRKSLAEQLENFALTAQTAFMRQTALPIAPPQNWLQGFRMLINLLEGAKTAEKKVIFLDEFPWLDNKKSGFLAAFDHFWNSWASKQDDLVVVICGSAASWMIQNIVRNKGGLHNRITQRIRLEPFNLHETSLFLRNNRINLSQYDILQLYMVTGGIPHYLNTINTGESTIQIIDRLCFTKDGGLRNEFKDLYPALFGRADKHIAVIRALAEKLSGLTRNEIIATCGFKTGGTVTKVLDELLESGFISEYLPFQKTAKEAIFKLSDEYSLFYLKFIENSKATGAGSWQSKATHQSWQSWTGFAFENICLKHMAQIKKALGISGIYTEQSVWRYTPKKGETGAQIDLLMDRQDNCINLFELKFYNDTYEMTARDTASLRSKRSVFQQRTGTKKTIFISLLTTFGAKPNEHYLEIVQNQLDMAVLFEP